MTILSRLRSARQFSLPDFVPSSLAFDGATAEELDELLLDRVVTAIHDQPNVTALAGPIPTAGELRARIDRHLGAASDAAGATASSTALDELRSALTEIRRSKR